MVRADIKCNDNLPEMEKMDGESVHMIYIDPPFFSQENRKDYDDRWSSRQAFLDFMKPRLVELRRVLKSSGSLYLQSDYDSSHYLKVMLDEVFGEENFLNEIIWYHKQGKRPKEAFGRKHGTIFLYTKGKDHVFNGDDITEPPSPGKLRDFSRVDEEGKNFRMKNGKKYYLKPSRPDDVIYHPPTQHDESVGYATQKPEGLIEIFVKASSNPGDTILDAFSGSGTTCLVAKKNGRNSICIDENPRACEIMESRLK